jgi:hypothetical protein
MAKTETIDVSEIKARVERHANETSSLRARMDRHYNLVTLADYEVPVAEGEFESMTTNDPFVQQTKITDMLANAYPQFVISQIKAKPGKTEREKISNTERLVYGFLRMADKRQGDFLQPPIQEQLAWHSPVRGWVAQRLLLWEEDGELVPDYIIWDVRNTYWGLGAHGLLWACYVYDKDVAAAEDEYNISNVPHSKDGIVTCYDYLDDEREITVISDVIVNTFEHKLKRVPVYIRPTGSMPRTQISSTSSDTSVELHTGGRSRPAAITSIDFQGMGILNGTADLFETRSKILSYLLTIVGQGTHTPLILEHNGGHAPELAVNPYIKGQTIDVDASLGQKIYPLYSPVMPKDAFALLQDIDRQISTAGAPPILFGGGGTSTNTASGLNLLSYYAKTVLMPHQKAIEGALEWMAMEVIRQVKDGDYSIEQMEGLDRLKKDFCISIKAGEIVDDRHVKCTLIPDLIQDIVSKAGVASSLVKDGIWSKQYARDWLGVQDTEAMQREVFTEEAMADPKIKAVIMADSLKEDNPELATKVLANAERTEAQQQQAAQQAGGGGNVAGVPAPMSPQAVVGNMQKPLNIPPEIAQQLNGAI